MVEKLKGYSLLPRQASISDQSSYGIFIAGLTLSVASQDKLRHVEAEMLGDRDLARQCIKNGAAASSSAT